MYSRSELRGSDHKPGLISCLLLILYLRCVKVFALFRAEVRIIDAVKRLALSRLLLESIVSTAPGEKLDEKLAALVFSPDFTQRLCTRLNRSTRMTDRPL